MSTLFRKLIFICIFIYTMISCANLQHKKINFKHILWTVDWSPNNETIAVGGNIDKLLFISTDKYKIRSEEAFPGTITSIQWHPTRNLVAVSTQDGQSPCKLLNLESGNSIILDHVHAHGARGIDWNHDGSILAVGDNEGHLSLYSNDGAFIKKIKIDPKSITGLHWHPFKNMLTTVGSIIGLYDIESDQIKLIKPRTEDVLMLCVAWHPSGKFFVTGDYGDYDFNYPALLQFWDIKGNKINEIEKSKAEYRNIRWSSDGELLATASDGIRLWSSDGELLKHKISKSLIWGIDWDAKDENIAISTIDGAVLFLDRHLKTLKRIDLK